MDSLASLERSDLLDFVELTESPAPRYSSSKFSEAKPNRYRETVVCLVFPATLDLRDPLATLE